MVRLRGLPYRVTPDDVRAFFRSESKVQLHLIDITIEVGPDGRPNGEALAEFGSEEDCERALSFDRQMLGNRYIEVRRGDKDSDSRGPWQHAIPVALQKGRPERPEQQYPPDEPRREGGEREFRHGGRGDRHDDFRSGGRGDRRDAREDNRGRRSRSRDRGEKRDRRFGHLNRCPFSPRISYKKEI